MSINMWDVWLASIAGLATYHLIENLYWELRSRYHTHQYNKFLDEFEDEYGEDCCQWFALLLRNDKKTPYLVDYTK